MKIFDVRNADGELLAFEVRNTWLTRPGVARIVRRIPGVQLVRTPHYFQRRAQDEFCEFVVGGATFIAWEPFGDSSRYWIGPRPSRPAPEIAVVRSVFAAA